MLYKLAVKTQTLAVPPPTDHDAGTFRLIDAITVDLRCWQMPRQLYIAGQSCNEPDTQLLQQLLCQAVSPV